MNFQRISPNISDTGNPSHNIISTDYNSVFQRRQTDSKTEDSRSSKNPIARSLLQRLTMGNESVWIRIGTLRESIGDTTGAMEAYNNALRFSSNTPTPLCKLGSILLRKGQLEQALIYIQQALALSGNSGEAWSLLGYYYLKTGAYEQAYEAFQSAIRLLGDQASAFLWYGIGLLYELNGSTDYALEAYQNALKLKPYSEQTIDIYLHIAHIYEEREALDVASEYLNKAFLHVSTFNFNTTILGEIFFRMGAIQELKRNVTMAKEFYLKALKESPNHAKSLQQLGWIEHEEGRSEDGFQLLKRAVEADPNDGQGWYLLGRLHMAKKEYRSAYDNYQHAVYCNSRNPRFWCSIGVLYYQMGQHRDAMDAYTRAIRLNPNLSEVWYDLGTLYESFSQYKDALDAYKKALELSPNNSQIKARVVEIEKNIRDENVGLSSRDHGWHMDTRPSSILAVETKEPEATMAFEMPKMSNVRDSNSLGAMEALYGEDRTTNQPIEKSIDENLKKPVEESEQGDQIQKSIEEESKDNENIQLSENWKKDKDNSASPSATASSSFNEDEECEVATESVPTSGTAIKNSVGEWTKREQLLTSKNNAESERHDDENKQEKEEQQQQQPVAKRLKTRRAQDSRSESSAENGKTFDENQFNEEKSSTAINQDTCEDTQLERNDDIPSEGYLSD
ncbi:General transcriptional corepressor trfA [Galdieria sulphuraria]|uniref:Uncharacterized protein n=1 Tax=Galdieria sulphuraria TaxID=130081 RepID=M2XYB0_GALSU|nr:uncharacterized protein Gasu_41290 [Galdieria sulphuraria]EME28439.1 hypothetical protein Gasu_41290 [Galdieria sulphuraria]GJD12217.1 General transcriptional corepressor trfA [Galdieria sulphuraria]|eukprot:XP_005704959.1 hypothetical protein Gasu_41290 [Galdieria sulphuraria]